MKQSYVAILLLWQGYNSGIAVVVGQSDATRQYSAVNNEQQ